MEQSSFYVRVKPENIKAIESYFYSSEISRNPETRQNKHPEGSVSYEVPLDGELFFSRTSLQDFQRQQRGKSLSITNGLIGHFVLNHYQRTDLESRYDLSASFGSIPLNIPLRNESLTRDDDLVSDRFKVLSNYDYLPNSPELNPVQIQVLIFDEESFKEALDLTEDNSNLATRASLTDKVAKELTIQQGFKPALMFLFKISLIMPIYAGDLINRTVSTPMLKTISLEWPFPTSQTHIALDILGGEAHKKLIYDPHQTRIEWGDIRFNKGFQREGVDAYFYLLPLVMLEVKQPSELYGKQILQGTVRIELPILLSGLDVKSYNALGEPTNMPSVDTKTYITVDFDLYPEDCFSNKTYAPYQHIQFEGLILEEMRVADIVKALQDRGFELRDEPLKQMESGKDSVLRSCTIRARRSEGPNQIDLWLKAEGTVSEVERMRERYGAERFTARVRTGHTVIYMRAELTGNGTRLTQILNEVQLLLKERLNRFVKLD